MLVDLRRTTGASEPRSSFLKLYRWRPAFKFRRLEARCEWAPAPYKPGAPSELALPRARCGDGPPGNRAAFECRSGIWVGPVVKRPFQMGRWDHGNVPCQRTFPRFTRLAVESTFIPSHWDLGGAVVRFSRPRSTRARAAGPLSDEPEEGRRSRLGFGSLLRLLVAFQTPMHATPNPRHCKGASSMGVHADSDLSTSEGRLSVRRFF